jgi:hypothetical protein
MAGVDIKKVQELIGHKSIQLTARYAHVSLEQQLAAVEKLCETSSALERPADTKTDTAANEGLEPLHPTVQ